MAVIGKKISALPTATGVNNADTILIVQAGVNKQTLVSTLLSNVNQILANLGDVTDATNANVDFLANSIQTNALDITNLQTARDQAIAAIALLNTDFDQLESLLAGKQNALGFTPVDAASRNQPNGFAGLTNGKINTNQLPSLAVGETFDAASQAQMLALPASKGDICIRNDDPANLRVYFMTGTVATDMQSWTVLNIASIGVASVAGKTNVVTLQLNDLTDISAIGVSLASSVDAAAARTILGLGTASLSAATDFARRGIDGRTDLGLGTAATAAATDFTTPAQLTSGLAGKINATEKGAISGVATLDATQKVPTSQIPDTITASTQAALNLKANSDHTHGTATTIDAGFISALDKTKLDGALTDAPNNTSQYARQGGAWAVVAGGGGTAPAAASSVYPPASGAVRALGFSAWEGAPITAYSALYVEDWGLFLVGYSSNIAWSTGAGTWVPVNTGAGIPQGFTYSPELGIVVVGYSGSFTSMWSADGKTWNNGTATDGSLTSKTGSATIWVPSLGKFFQACSGATDSGGVRSSVDGKAWLAEAGVSGNIYGLDWSEELGILVAVGSTVGKEMWTMDRAGVWTLRVAPSGGDTRAAAWSPALSRFVVGSNVGTTRWHYSDDGLTWLPMSGTLVTQSSQYAYWSEVLQLFLLSSRNSGSTTHASKDGVTTYTIPQGFVSSGPYQYYDVPSQGRVIAAGASTVTTPSILTDAPSDSSQYARKNGIWSPVTSPLKAYHLIQSAAAANTVKTIGLTNTPIRDGDIVVFNTADMAVGGIMFYVSSAIAGVLIPLSQNANFNYVHNTVLTTANGNDGVVNISFQVTNKKWYVGNRTAAAVGIRLVIMPSTGLAGILAPA